LDLDVRNFGVVTIGGVRFWITETLVWAWVIMAVLIIFAVIVRIKLNKFKDVPKGFQNVVEMMVETFDKFVRDSAGERLMFLGNWFFTVFLFILVSNLSGLIPGFRPPTADWTVTFAFALATFILIQVMGIKYRGKEYIKSFFQPFFLFFPLNLIGELARPISLSFRLFGNILAGTIVMTLLYSMAPVFIRFVIPAALHGYFDVFAGVLQTYIFCALSLTFVGGAAALNED